MGLLQPLDPAASIFNGSIHLCIHCLLIPCQIGSEKDKPTNQDLSNPSIKKVQSGCNKQSKMSRNGNVSKHGSISLLKAPVSKMNDGKPTKKPPFYQAPFIGVPRLPKYIRKQMRGKTSKPWPTTSFKRV